MAKYIGKKSTEKPRTLKQKVEDLRKETITLELTKYEALALKIVTGRVGGKPEEFRGATDEIYQALSDVPDVLDIYDQLGGAVTSVEKEHSAIYFEDYKDIF